MLCSIEQVTKVRLFEVCSVLNVWNKKRSAVSGECEIDKSLTEALAALKLESFCNLVDPGGWLALALGIRICRVI